MSTFAFTGTCDCIQLIISPCFSVLVAAFRGIAAYLSVLAG